MDDQHVLKEHTSSEEILSTIPSKVQHGFRTSDIKITCMDAERTHLLFGTDTGAGFLYNRQLGSNIKLLSESRYDVITSVKLLAGMECQAALGTEDGKLTIVIFSNSTADSTKDVQKYSLGNIHQSAVTCMEWSSNGMKLFTGDKNGNIYLTEVDFEKNKCNSFLLHTEHHEIVQLCYKLRILLISTTERTLLCRANNEENKVTAVGSKPTRRGYFGSCFSSCTASVSDPRVFCTRPGHRIWVANTEGKVTSTLLMKDLVQGNHPNIQLRETIGSIPDDEQFGRLLYFAGEFLISYSDRCIFIIDHKNRRIIGSNKGLNKVLSVSTTASEIFILCENRQLHRIAELPDDTLVKRITTGGVEKPRDGQSVNFQHIKGSLSGMKKTFTPLVGALQLGMSSFNAEAEQWSQKLQTQAKVLQKKIPAVATSLFMKDSETIPAPAPDSSVNPTSSNKHGNADEDCQPDNAVCRSDSASTEPTLAKSNEDDSQLQREDHRASDEDEHDMQTSCITEHVRSHNDITNEARNVENDVTVTSTPTAESKNRDQEFLHSQGDPQLQTSVELHFEKFDKVISDADGEIVFNSKRKKKLRPVSSPKNSGNSNEGLFRYGREENITSDLHSSRTDIGQDKPTKNTDNSREALKTDEQEQTDLNMEVVGAKNMNLWSCGEHDLTPQDATPGPSKMEVGASPVSPKCGTPDHNQFDAEQQEAVASETAELVHNKSESSSPAGGYQDKMIDQKKSDDSFHTGNISQGGSEELVIAVHKTAGNQLCPEIIMTPTGGGKFSDVFKFPENLLARPDKDEDSPTELRTPQNTIPVLKDECGTPRIPPKLNTSVSHSYKRDAWEAPIEKTDEKCEREEIMQRTKKATVASEHYEPLFSESESDNNSEILREPPALDVSFSEDIYQIESAKSDFESENDSYLDDLDIEPQSKSESDKKQNQTVDPQVGPPNFLSIRSAGVPVRLLDSWSTASAPHDIINISGSADYIWYIDYNNNIYITEGGSTSHINWKKLLKKGTQLCISPSGDIAWLISRSGKAYASVLPFDLLQRTEPLQINWQLVKTGVSKVTLGVNSAWAVSATGGIKAQFGLSRSIPFKSCWDLIGWNTGKITHITLTKSMVWCRTDAGKLFTADQMSIDKPDFRWEEVETPMRRDNTPSAIQSIASDFTILWAVDDQGSMWFLSEERKWWQVNLSQYIDENHRLAPYSLIQSLPITSKVSDSVHKFQRWMSRSIKVQNVAANNMSVWVVFDKQKIHVSKGPLTGCRWDVTTPLGVAKSTRWQHITTSSVFSSDQGNWLGLVWASQRSNEIFCFPSQDVAKTHPVIIIPPVEEERSITCMSACKEALWVLIDDGSVYIRSGISSECLKGIEWKQLDVRTQLGNIKLIHFSCGSQNVWAVDSNGRVYFRIGVTAVDGHSLAPAWIPIEGCQTPGCHFTQIECGVSDSSVWALDNFANVYVRTEVSSLMPVGSSWEIVPGSHVHQLCISNHTVWGLRDSGSVIRRFGISERNLLGDYWKKTEGKFIKLAVTPYDELWAIDRDQHLRHRFTSVYCPPVVEAQYKVSPKEYYAPVDHTSDVDWEFI